MTAMAEIKRITIEGFEDLRGDYDTGIYICKPIVEGIDASTIENVIEDFCIDLSLGNTPTDDDYLDRRFVLNNFYRIRQKNTRDMKYFRAVVEVLIGDENEVYRIIEREGF